MIQKVHILKFRGFKDVEFMLGSQITAIAGKNGTQKSTLLGLLSQPFSLREHATMKGEKPLCGGSYISAFADKFKLSKTFDIAGNHEWTLFFDNRDPFTVESISRDKAKGTIRFWQKGSREKGTGYIQLPVIFLSLKRLFPIGEDEKIHKSNIVQLTPQEDQLFKDLHKKILVSNDKILSADYIESPDKNTLAVNTNSYDWSENSAGQDNVSKIILALLSFKRLKEKFRGGYKGGLLVIDELDATMYPASQYKLLEFIRKFASKLKLQIIFTTHSLSLLEKVCDLHDVCSAKPETRDQVKVVFLEKKDNDINVIDNVSFATMKNRLNVAISNKKVTKIPIFTEDDETMIFVRNLLRGRISKLSFCKVSLSCSALVDLVYRKIPHFIFPDSMIVLDGDVKNNKGDMRKIKGAKNVLLLPTTASPERVLAKMLYNLKEKDLLWESINRDYSKSVCFRDYSYEDIYQCRTIAKKWFNQQKDEIGREWCIRVINNWKKENKEEYDYFVNDFIEKYNYFADALSIDRMK